MVKLAAALLCAGCFLLTVTGNDDFELADALDKGTPKPPPATKKPSVDGNSRPKLYPDLRPHGGGNGNNDPDFHLGDALGAGDGPPPNPQPYPRPRPQPGSHINSGDFNDLDLNDGRPPPPGPAGGNEHISNQGGNTVDSSAAQISSPVVIAVVLLACGAIAGYTAYKKKRYCFKPRGGAVV
ncbi:glycoprotein Xg [Podarcis raffonei]|uniref:glycoprotein Xg n=1 Tax=Podarcis raffonei TaxID=65483 RepID=UPI002329073D|nr:glycoprotein Xg [Podarcis raffonei]